MDLAINETIFNASFEVLFTIQARETPQYSVMMPHVETNAHLIEQVLKEGAKYEKNNYSNCHNVLGNVCAMYWHQTL